MNKYHIMYFFDYGKEFGGAVNALMQQALLMKRAGHKTTIAISTQDNKISQEYQDICVANEIEHIPLDYPISSNPENIDIVSVVSAYDSVKRKIEELKPDILHSVQINPVVELVGRELQIPHIMNIYQLIPDFFSVPYIDIFPHYHICDSRCFAEQWHSHLGTDSICIRTVVNYSDINAERILETDNSIHFICVGIVCRRKNQLNVIEAFHLALQRGVKGTLYIYGYESGEYGDLCKDYVKNTGLEEKVIFKGFCSNMSVEYKKNDVLICGSTMESYPNVISEALANGLVVISTPVAGVPEVIKDGYNGYLCSGFSREEIGDKIVQFDMDRKYGRIAQLIGNAYDTYKKYHSPEIVGKELAEYYAYVTNGLYSFSDVKFVDVKKKFSDIIRRYDDKYDYFTKPKSVRLRLWYIYHIKYIIDNLIKDYRNSFYIWGTGKYAIVAKEILEVFFPDLRLDGFIDGYKEGGFCGLEIFRPDDLLRDNQNVVFVGIEKGQEEVIQVLKKLNRECNKDYFLLAPRRW